jgi:hypothetical protein
MNSFEKFLTELIKEFYCIKDRDGVSITCRLEYKNTESDRAIYIYCEVGSVVYDPVRLPVTGEDGETSITINDKKRSFFWMHGRALQTFIDEHIDDCWHAWRAAALARNLDIFNDEVTKAFDELEVMKILPDGYISDENFESDQADYFHSGNIHIYFDGVIPHPLDFYYNAPGDINLEFGIEPTTLHIEVITKDRANSMHLWDFDGTGVALAEAICMLLSDRVNRLT